MIRWRGARARDRLGIRAVGEIETCCTRLARNEQFIRSEGASHWPDGTIASGYRFLHALYQEVLYDRAPVGSRAEAHRRIAAREETAYGEQADEIAAELANRYRRANDNDKAVKYFQLAGARAATRSAFAEAMGHAQAGLALIPELSAEPHSAAIANSKAAGDDKPRAAARITQGRRDEARAMLAAIYNWFAEGFDTLDLKDAKTLLDELSINAGNR